MIKYLCIVGDIEAQADQAGLELLRAQSARVVLGGQCQARRRSGGATGHAATHTAVSVTVKGRGREGGREVGKVMLDRGVHHAQGVGVEGGRKEVRLGEGEVGGEGKGPCTR